MKSTGRFLVASLFLLSGLVCFTIGLFILDFDIKSIATNAELTEYQEVYDCPTDKIVIDDRNVSVKLLPSDDDQVHLTYFAGDHIRYEIDHNDSMISIRKSDGSHWYERIFTFAFDDHDLTLYVPTQFRGNLDIDSSNGSIRLEDLETLENAKLESSNGRISLKNCDIKEKLDCETSNGKVELYTIDAEDINIKTSNGKIEMETVRADRELRCKTSNAKIEFDMIDCGTNIYLKTSNGAIDGTIVGRQSDYSIESDTSNGHNNLPDRTKDGDKQLEVDTSNGRIEVDFEEDGWSDRSDEDDD